MKRLAAILLLALAFPSIAKAEPVVVPCLRVVDGDTVVVLVNGLQARVRLLGIDTPEKGEPYAAEATAYVKERCEGRMVRLDCHGVGKYGRNLCWMWDDAGYWIEMDLVSEGLACVYMLPEGYQAIMLRQKQKIARENHRGIWGGK